MATLVRRDGNGVSIFLDGRPDNIQDAAIMPEMDHFCALRLDQAAHDIDCGVMAIEQGGCCDETQGRYSLGGGLWYLVSGSAHITYPVFIRLLYLQTLCFDSGATPQAGKSDRRAKR
jgi:hypothetical protein